jgi:hypothetical protein
MKAIGQTELGQALHRIDAALGALTAQLPNEEGATTNGEQRKRRQSTGGNSVRSKAQQLLDEADRSWDYEAILAEYEHRGKPITAANPKAALRTALWSMVNDHDAVRVGNGVFKSARFES